jgi:hypothetical protein
MRSSIKGDSKGSVLVQLHLNLITPSFMKCELLSNSKTDKLSGNNESTPLCSIQDFMDLFLKLDVTNIARIDTYSIS